MKEFLKKLTSRKFLMSVAGFISGLAMVFTQQQDSTIQKIGVILSGSSVIIYIVVEGLIDKKSIDVENLINTTKDILKNVKSLTKGDD